MFFNVSFYRISLIYTIENLFFDFSFVLGFEIVNRYLVTTNDIWYLNNELKHMRYHWFIMPIHYIGMVLYLIKYDWVYSNNFHFIAWTIFTDALNGVFFWGLTVFIPIYKNVKTPYHVRLTKNIRLRAESQVESQVESQLNSPRIDMTNIRTSTINHYNTAAHHSSNNGTILRLQVGTNQSSSGGDGDGDIDNSIPTTRQSISMGNSPKNNRNINKIKVKGSIFDIFNDSVTFDLFMTHLNKEFAIENGLFLIYLLQYQQFLINIGILSNNQTNLLIFKGRLTLPNSVPQSSLFEVNSDIKIITSSSSNSTSNTNTPRKGTDTNNIVYDYYEHKTQPQSQSVVEQSKNSVIMNGHGHGAYDNNDIQRTGINNVRSISGTTSPTAAATPDTSNSITLSSSKQNNSAMISQLISKYDKNKDIVVVMLNAFIVIYEKFVKPGYATFEVNISSFTRKQLIYRYEEVMKIILNTRKFAIVDDVTDHSDNKIKLIRSRTRVDENDLKQFDTSTSSDIDVDFDFFDLWGDLMTASNQTLGLMNQSVSRYFAEKLM